MISLRTIEQTGLAEILVFLLGRDKARITDIFVFLRSQGVGQSTMYRALKLLKENQMIDEEITDYPKLRLIRLTPKGRRVAEKLLEIKKILEEETEDEK